jgi:hypothetical protein
MIQQNQALTVPRAGTVWEIQCTSSSSIESTRKFKNITVEEAREGARKVLAGCDQGRDSNCHVSQWQTFVGLSSGPLTAALRRALTIKICKAADVPIRPFSGSAADLGHFRFAAYRIPRKVLMRKTSSNFYWTKCLEVF